MSTLRPPTPIRRASRTLAEHVSNVTFVYHPDVVTVLEAIADALEATADEHATGSRDFGRGYMHAVRLLRGE